VEELCDRVAVIQDGRRVAAGSPRALLDRGKAPIIEAVVDGGKVLRFDLDDDEARMELSDRVRRGEVTSLQTRAGDFREAFLRMTGDDSEDGRDRAPHGEEPSE
jgi:ABC-type multidrug transport system ATPase subunit